MVGEQANYVSDVVRSIEQLEAHVAVTDAALRELNSQLAPLPIFVKGFVLSEITRGSGQNMDSWTATMSSLIATLTNARDTLFPQPAEQELTAPQKDMLSEVMSSINSEKLKFNRLRTFMAEAPAKVEKVPTGMLPASRREEFVTQVGEQLQSIEAALGSMDDVQLTIARLLQHNSDA